MFGNKINLLFITVMVTLIGFSESGRFVSLPATNPDYPNKCYDEKLKKAFAVGESYMPEGECANITCQSDFSFIGIDCDPREIYDPKCEYVGYQLERGYPGCCQFWECTDEDGKIYRI